MLLLRDTLNDINRGGAEESAILSNASESGFVFELRWSLFIGETRSINPLVVASQAL